ncbi:Sterol methyltransferase C-terminal [Dillenia turbinata]|uniref:Sterol methyltransferase C-terminal n=1 Tax=Dillenia turbinata TaxID=194707 RepID=A0AAN8W5J6_9MAGN
MDPLILFSIAALIFGGIYWFLYPYGGSISPEKVEDRVLKPGAMYVSYEMGYYGTISFEDISETARKVGFEIVMEKDLAKPPTKPWWLRLKMGTVAYWRNHILVSVLAFLEIAPKVVVDVHEMLLKTADYLTRGGETGIFAPMRRILCRKPLNFS